MGTNVYTANQDIRDYLMDHSVTQRMLAAHLGVSCFSVNKMLKNELSQKEKEDLLNKIDAIASENKGIAHEEPEAEAETLHEEDNSPQGGGCFQQYQVPDR